MPSTYLTLTPDGGGNQRKFTFSVWCKKSAVNPASSYFLFGTGTSTNYTHLYFDSNHNLVMKGRASSSTFCNVITTRKFRDENSFYHIVVAVDTEQGTAADRVKMYVNGVQETSFGTATYPSQNADFENQNASTPFKIGTNYDNTADESFSGIMTHFHYVDGTQLTPATFGETDSTSGIWKPKASPTGITYGTNGFFLKFENSGAMGTDSSGNSNTFTVSGNLTQNVDTPSNVFCTLNTLIPTSNITYSNGNLTMATSTYSNFPLGTQLFTAGKWYYEVKMSSTHMKIGFAEVEVPQGDPDNAAVIPAYWIYSNGSNVITANNHSGSNQSTRSGFTNWGSNDILGLAIDLDNGKFYASLNGTWYNSADPANGTNALITSITARESGQFTPFLGSGTSSSRTNHINFGSGFFGTTAVASANADANGHGAMEYAVPNGFYTICTKNIKEFG